MSQCAYVATFAFVQPPPAFSCEGARRAAAAGVGHGAARQSAGDERLSSSHHDAREGEAVGDTLGTATAAVLYISLPERQTRIYTFRFTDGDRMEGVYRALHSRLSPGTWCICYTPAGSRAGTAVRSCVDRILYLDDVIPPRIVCQAMQLPVAVPRSKDAHRPPFVVLNTLIMVTGQEFHVGHVPLVLSAQAAPLSQAEMVQQLATLLGLTGAETAFARRLAVVACRVVGGRLVIEGSAPSEGDGQVALLFPAVDVGDVVRVDCGEDLLASSSTSPRLCGARVATQGIVLRHTTQNGVRRFDVQCIDGSTTATVELRGLSCFQVIPL